jgi:glycosyltransferase involved in cell wall biosynthesis
MVYDTALRGYTTKRLEEIEKADILIGIPCHNNEKTIAHVIQMVTHGLDKHYKNLRNVIFIADGGSTDDTREVAKEFQVKPWQEKIVSIYRGAAGKGTALRSIFETAQFLKVKACATVDSDLRSITSDWVKYLLDPIIEKGYQFVSPIYFRHKYDGTITNNIAYNLTRALYGMWIRQPIGGDFAFSRETAHFYSDQDVWDSDVARFGIDIWMTTSAITQRFKICQANLGVKIHDVKNPGAHLGPMFYQVLATIFYLMEKNENYWKRVTHSKKVKTFGLKEYIEPEPIAVNREQLVYRFKMGFRQFGVFWKAIFSPECFEEIERLSTLDAQKLIFPLEIWVMILYELAATYHQWKINRNRLIDFITPLYYARVASFVNQTWDMNSFQAEKLVEEQAAIFEYHKGYLVELWDQDKKEDEVVKQINDL